MSWEWVLTDKRSFDSYTRVLSTAYSTLLQLHYENGSGSNVFQSKSLGKPPELNASLVVYFPGVNIHRDNSKFFFFLLSVLKFTYISRSLTCDTL